MPDWLLWLCPVPLATLAALAWTAWTGRRRGPADPAETVAEHARLRAALSAPGAAPPPPAVRTLPRPPRDGVPDQRSGG